MSHQSQIAHHGLVSGLLLCVLAVGALGQAGYTPSHRRLPLTNGQKTPTIDDFLKSKELNELRREYDRIRRKRREEQRVPRSRPRPGESRRDQLQRERQLAEELHRNMPMPNPKDIAEQIESASEELGRKLGGALAETLRPGTVQFDPKTSFWDQASEMLDTIGRKEREAKEQFDQAMEIYKRTWPTETVAPTEWLEKVQPFVNSEVIEQLSEASRHFEAQKHLPPNERRFPDFNFVENDASKDFASRKSHSMFDSLLKSIDKQGTDWLKSKDKKPKSGLWKSLSKGTKNRISQFNRTMTENSRNRAGAGNVAASPTSMKHPRAGSPRTVPKATAPSNSSNSLVWIALALIGGVAAVFYYRNRTQSSGSSSRLSSLQAESIHDCDSLLTACHQLALGTFGLRSRFWNHRKLFGQLSERVDGRSHIIEQLSQMYERARYAPERLMLAVEIERARNLFSQLQRGLGSR